MSLKIPTITILLILLLSTTAIADNTAPTTYYVGYKLWGKWFDFMGNTGAVNGTIGGTGQNLTIIPINVDSCTVKNSNALGWNGTGWNCVSLNGLTLYNIILYNVTTVNATSINATSVSGNGSGLSNINTANLTVGTPLVYVNNRSVQTNTTITGSAVTNNGDGTLTISTSSTGNISLETFPSNITQLTHNNTPTFWPGITEGATLKRVKSLKLNNSGGLGIIRYQINVETCRNTNNGAVTVYVNGSASGKYMFSSDVITECNNYITQTFVSNNTVLNSGDSIDVYVNSTAAGNDKTRIQNFNISYTIVGARYSIFEP